MDYNEIAAKLLAAYNESPYSYGELSKLTGIPKAALQRYITGDTRKIPLDRLRLICDKLGLDAAELLGWDQEPQPSAQDEELQLMYNQFAQLSPAEQRRVLDFVAGILSAREP